MAGVEFIQDVQGLDRAADRIRALAGFERAEMMMGAAAILESGARRRIVEEKAAPDGTPWAPWSARYAKTRGPQHSLLIGEGELLDSIASSASADEARVGSNLVYAAIQHSGGEEIGRPGHPERPYLGMSGEEARDIEEFVAGFLDDAVSGR